MVKYELDLVFKALANPTRRAILDRLAHGDARVGELAEPFQISWPAVTKHLGLLERAGLVGREKEGTVRRCRLVAGPMRAANQWIKRYEAFWTERLDTLADYLDRIDENRERT